MRTTLLIAEPDDPLAQHVGRLVPRALRCTQRELLERGRLSLQQDGVQVRGALGIGTTSLPFESVAGVLYRPHGAPPRHRKKLGAFVHHERQAAWCAALYALPCAVVNRMPPGWWLDPELHRCWLADRFALELALPRRHDAPAPMEVRSAYVIEGDVAPGAPAWLRRHLAANPAALGRWQEATGVRIARIDIVGRTQGVVAVDPFPALREAAPALLAHIGPRVARLLA